MEAIPHTSGARDLSRLGAKKRTFQDKKGENKTINISGLNKVTFP